MRLRIVLNYCFIALGLGVASQLHAQDAPAKRLAAIIAVAVEEYRLGIDANGKIISKTELDEAREFLVDAKDAAARLSTRNAGTTRALVDSLVGAVSAARTRAVVDSLYARIVRELGDEGALDLPSRHVDVAAGKTLYQQNCQACHGAVGFGDGPAAKSVNPPPAALAGPATREMAPALIYRVVSVGVKGTAMAPWANSLSSDQRWDVVAYVNALRAEADAANGGGRVAKSVESEINGFLDRALAAARSAQNSEAGDRAFDAYAAFEPVETLARPKNAKLVARLESSFLDFRVAVRSGDTTAAITAQSRIRADLPDAIAMAGAAGSGWAMFAPSFLIILREGFEAILIIGAIVGMLIKTGNRSRVKEVWLGSALAVAASIGTAVLLQTTLRSLPATREVIEGVTMLVSVVVLFSVSYWILSKVESDRWQAFIRDKVSTAVNGGGRAALAGVAFLVVYREGAETVLFYQALAQEAVGTLPHVLAGLVAGSATLGVVYYLFHRYGVRIPLRPFFAATGSLLYLMAFVFIGKGLRELQEGGVLSVTPLPRAPHIDLLGVYPSVETLAGQWLLLGLFVLACWHTFATPLLSAPRKSRDVQVPASDERASTPVRTP